VPGCVDRLIIRPQEILHFHPHTLMGEIYIKPISWSKLV
jgi:hypothetical protein